MTSTLTRERLAALRPVLERPGPLVILPHDNPDPDAMACAAALRFLAQEMCEKEAVIVLGGIVGRAENRAMRTYLNINLVPVGEIDFGEGVQVALVDTQPGRPNNSLPEGIEPVIVIDHHPAYADYGHLPFVDLRDGYGATATIMTEYLREAKVTIESKLATALFYGIAAETQDLGREATAADIEASHFLYPHTNKRRLAKIENARVPREYFRVFRDAIDRATLYDRAVVSILGEVQYPDMAAEVADFMLRLDQVEWAAALATYRGCLHCSVRTTERDVNAGEMLRRVLGAKSAGGHDMIAGGRIPVDNDPQARQRVVNAVRDKLLAELGIEDEGRSLV
jgi:nanoRNase/pAp phosphatase (c-di-AMP/oligoRNAs hydrolase)